MKTKRPSMNVY